MTLVSEAMNRSPAVVTPETTVEDAAALARATGASHLLVLDCDNLVGILCACDLQGARPGEYTWERMTLPVLTIRPDATLEDAALTLGDCDVGCLPVALGGLVLGTVSCAELSRAGAAGGQAGACHHHRDAPAWRTRH